MFIHQCIYFFRINGGMIIAHLGCSPFYLFCKLYYMGYHEYKRCIDTCLACAAICNHCASASTKEKDVAMMAECIRLDMECAVVCYAVAQVMSIGGKTAKALCSVCADACDACADECAKHDNEHCKECAAACRACADVCRAM
jgi:hypothetical protein